MDHRNNHANQGFALVVSLTMLVLLTVIAVGLLSLSAITLRTSTQNSAQAEAQANARMALMIAIGELQKQMGPDQRISANGAITSTTTVANPHWTGVWDSWIAGPLSAARTNPNYPNDPMRESHHQTIGDQDDMSMSPDYDKNKYFRRWLVSLNPDEAASISSASDLALDGEPFPGEEDDAIRLVGVGSMEDAAAYVSARLVSVPTSVSSGSGRYAWWVGDESQKARVMHDTYVSTPPANDASKIHRMQSPGSTGTNKIRDMEDLTAAQDLKLEGLPSMKTLDLVAGGGEKMPYRKNFHDVTAFSSQVFADVREGGLKRDLSTILELPINREDSGDEYMLYAFDDPRFDDRTNSRVPIQDLSAYYQLYNDIKPGEAGYGVNGREGVRYNSTQLANSIQTNVPDYDGGTKDRQRLLREYTALYKQPVLTKLQFILGVSAEEITPEDRSIIESKVGPTGDQNPSMPVNAGDTHKLTMGIMPMVTLWNPTNLPMVMADTQILRVKSAPPVIFKWRKSSGGVVTFETPTAFGPLFFTSGEQVWQLDGRDGGYGFLTLRLGGDAGRPVVFKPGEVKIFTLADSFGNLLTEAGNAKGIDARTRIPTTNTPYDPFKFVKLWHSHTYHRTLNPHVYVFTDSAGKNKKSRLVFNANDRFSFWINHDRAPTNYADSQAVARASTMAGAAFAFTLTDPQYDGAPWQEGLTFLEHYAMNSRHGGRKMTASDPTHARMASFNEQLITPGFPGGVTPLDFNTYTNAIKGDQIIGAGNNGEVIGLMDFSLSLGCEVGTLSAGGHGGGRRIASRPFLHSGVGAPPFIDQSGKDWLYNYGWDWQIGTMNALEDSIVTAKPDSDNGYFGGGYTIEAGTTQVVQREIPVLPSISIASLSHAQLGGFSLAYAVNYDGIDPATGKVTPWTNDGQLVQPKGVDFQKTTAVGQGGLAPHVSQAIGNSYAHPNIPANLAFTTKIRRFDEDPGEGDKVVPFVDHSYLANKALWDEFFFSSIAPQPAKVPLFGGTARTTKQMADDFFKLGSPLSSSPLPNRRIKPYSSNLNQSKLDTLFSPAQNIYANGLADKLAAHLMVEGAFNVNSTSVEAWKVFLSSLKGKPVAYLDGGTAPKEVTPAGTTISSSSLPNDEPVKSSDIIDINAPEEQWTAGRELTEDEIDELATAMVKQVKLRGPFLSMSEFVNRRLEGDTGAAGERSVKGALQAALDDPNVTINANFRTPGRLLDSETASIPFDFPDAAKGPIAYGSMAYVDQADVLRGFAEQLTPRGDTFVIRTYGDSLDSTGKVVARAWCEAVVQRVPEYLNSLDESHVKSANLASDSNRIFGRKIQIVSFRWINPSEI